MGSISPLNRNECKDIAEETHKEDEREKSNKQRPQVNSYILRVYRLMSKCLAGLQACTTNIT